MWLVGYDGYIEARFWSVTADKYEKPAQYVGFAELLVVCMRMYSHPVFIFLKPLLQSAIYVFFYIIISMHEMAQYRDTVSPRLFLL